MTAAVVHVNRGAFVDAPEALLERAVRLVLGRAPGRAPGAEPPPAPAGVEGAPAAAHAGDAGAEVSLTLLDDAAMADLNRRYLGRAGTTDVLAFALGEPGGAPLGDVYVGYEQAARQAREHGVPLDEELARLAIHGALHVLGHDHPEGPERLGSPMFALQERLLAELVGRSR